MDAVMFVPFIPGMEPGFHSFEEAEEDGIPFFFPADPSEEPQKEPGDDERQ